MTRRGYSEIAAVAVVLSFVGCAGRRQATAVDVTVESSVARSSPCARLEKHGIVDPTSVCDLGSHSLVECDVSQPTHGAIGTGELLKSWLTGPQRPSLSCPDVFAAPQVQQFLAGVAPLTDAELRGFGIEGVGATDTDRRIARGLAQILSLRVCPRSEFRRGYLIHGEYRDRTVMVYGTSCSTDSVYNVLLRGLHPLYRQMMIMGHEIGHAIDVIAHADVRGCTVDMFDVVPECKAAELRVTMFGASIARCLGRMIASDPASFNVLDEKRSDPRSDEVRCLEERWKRVDRYLATVQTRIDEGMKGIVLSQANLTKLPKTEGLSCGAVRAKSIIEVHHLGTRDDR